MKIARILAPIAALTLASAPVVAQAADAEVSRTASPTSDFDSFAGDATTYILFGFLVGIAILLVTMHEDEPEDLPLSP